MGKKYLQLVCFHHRKNDEVPLSLPGESQDVMESLPDMSQKNHGPFRLLPGAVNAEPHPEQTELAVDLGFP
jgi:hypothetical protein